MTFLKWAGAAAALVATLSVAHAQTTPDDGRLLASGCFQCHATGGRGGFDTLAGKSKSEILGELNEMRRQAASSDIMTPHARGYTNEQLNLIADWFSRQPRP